RPSLPRQLPGRHLAIAVHQHDQRLLRLVLHHDRLDHRVLVDAQLSRRRAGAAMFFVAVLVLGERDLVLAQLAKCGGGGHFAIAACDHASAASASREFDVRSSRAALKKMRTRTRAAGTIFSLDRRDTTMPSSSSMSATSESPGDVRARLRAHFGHADFRPGQEEIVAAVLGARDVLAVMPTGSGKSLGYQLPAMMLPGTTLVVSPLISLMKDQVDELNRRGIASASLHSLLSAEARREAWSAARAGALRLLYVAPERFASDQFLRLLGELEVARFVVDEAHCVSEWGHDFRPDYRRLRAAAAQCRRADRAPGRPPIAAFTATATPEVRDDIVALLGLDQPQVLVAGFDRPNIFLRVQPVNDADEKDELLPPLVRGRRALVYAATRKTAEGASASLREAGVEASVYHAGLEDRERVRVQDAFASGSLQVVCATNAFGMGIDRPDVDAVVHYAIPGSVEAYYQEIGRAGRDGRAATATLLWDPADVETRRFLIDSPRRDKPQRHAPLDPAEVARRRELEHAKLQRMIEYAGTAACLRATILRYLGDPAENRRPQARRR